MSNMRIITDKFEVIIFKSYLGGRCIVFYRYDYGLNHILWDS